ncbi:MAG: T9SS type A sorting domain-containing protein, partial [Thermotogae bacterium]|nr:T9SS type A sorting domain-containing protein [Thermotogota bacterium]
SNDLNDGNDYKIKVSDVNNSNIYAYSGTFEIRSSSNECDTMLVVNSYITLYAGCIQNDPSGGYYVLAGNPNVNHILYFTDTIYYDGSVLWGDSDARIGDVYINFPEGGFRLEYSGDTLSFAHDSGNIWLAGCIVHISKFKISHDYVEVMGSLFLPFTSVYVDSLIVDKDEGITLDIRLTGYYVHEGWKLANIELYYSQPTNSFIGGMELSIPLFISISSGLKIIEGEIDSIYFGLGGLKVPIDLTGLFLTDIGGGISNIRKGPWRMIVCGGITGGPEVAEISIIKAEGCFISAPFSFFKATELTLKLLETYDLASAYLVYDLRALDLEFAMNLFVVGGEFEASMQSTIINGQFEGHIGLDSARIVAWPIILFIPSIKIAGVNGTFTNNTIQGMFVYTPYNLGFYRDITLAYRVEFYPGNIDLYVGTNYDNLIQVTKTADSVVYFNVDAYTPRILVFVGDIGNREVPISRVISPSGQVYDSSYQYYAEKDGLGIYIIDAPEYGRWRVEVEEGTNYNVYTLAERPPLLVDFVDTSSGVIDAGNPIEIWAPKDSTCINLYLAEDKEDLGTFVGSTCLDKGVNRVNIPLFESGEYYVRAQTTTDPYAFSVYSPFRLRFSQEDPTPCPGSITVESQDSGILVMWDTSGIDTSEILGYSVYFKSSRDKYWTSYGVSRDSNKVFLTDLRGGRNYVFKVGTYDVVGNKSPETCMPVDSIIYSQSTNNPPYIADYPKKIRAQVGSTYQYDLTVGDIDGDAFSLYLMHAPVGMYTYGNKLMWNVPDSIMSGRVLLIAHDENGAEDSVEIFYSTVDTAIFKPRLLLDRNVYDTYDSKAVIQYVHFSKTIENTKKTKTYLIEDTILLRVYSKSDPTGLNVPLYEVSPGSGLYKAVIGFTSDPSSGTNLHVEGNDTIFVRYETLEARAIFTEDPLTPVDYGEKPAPGSEKIVFGFELVDLERGKELVARLSMPEKEKIKIEIYSINGRKILTPVDGIYDRGLHIIRMDVSSLTTGVYVLRVYTESGESVYRKFIMLR